MSRTRVKICGVTRPGDAEVAVAAGADAIGMIFFEGSPRAIDVAGALQVAGAVPPFVTLVGLFVDADAETVREVCNEVPLGLLQFHGNESEVFCTQFGLPWMKAIRVAPETDVSAEMSQWPAAHAILLDTYRLGQAGGTGETFDWEQVPARRSCPLVLAGGLNADNVGAAIASASPFAVDVCGGVEAEPGIKDASRIQQFMDAVRTADGR